MQKKQEAKAVIEGLEDVKAGRTVDGQKAIDDIRSKYENRTRILPDEHANPAREQETDKMEIRKIDGSFSVCRVEDYSQVDLNDEFTFTGKTDEEVSLVCPSARVPANTIRRDDGWKAMRIQGVLDFSLIGILSKIATVLAENRIGIFAVSTYNTDYILVHEDSFDSALDALKSAGYQIV